MANFFDAQCRKCKRKFGWRGSLTDRPPCPKCGDTIPHTQLQAEEAKLQGYLDKIHKDNEAKEAREWAARTPDQETAYAQGNEAVRSRGLFNKGMTIRPLDEPNPFSYQTHPDLHGWWLRGWRHAQYGKDLRTTTT